MSMKETFGKQHKEYSRIVQKNTSKAFDELWSKKEIPEEPWPEYLVEAFLVWIAGHDTNNRVDTVPVGAGEREGRVASSIVRRLHANLSHGIGRSGNLLEIQPKALGSSMLNCLSCEFALNALRIAGIPAKSAVVLPLATGMSLMMCMLSWRSSRPNAKYVIFPRVDQKSCFKSILAAGYTPLIVEPLRVGDALVTDVREVRRLVEKNPEEILCMMGTTSSFAPRSPDDIISMAAIAAENRVPLLVNNAYGLQSTECTQRIAQARVEGRVDACVQSLDKNFQVPVGGAIVAFFKQSQAAKFAQMYPGRASCVPSRDLVLTLLDSGVRGFRSSLDEQRRLFNLMREEAHKFAERIGENVYEVDDNRISLAITLATIPPTKQTLFGAVLFSRGVTGARVVPSTTKSTSIEGFEFVNFGSHTSSEHGGYVTIACGVGMTETEVGQLFTRLSTVHRQFIEKNYSDPDYHFDDS